MRPVVPPSWLLRDTAAPPMLRRPRRALLRGRLGHARRASTSGAQGIVRAGATSRMHSVLLMAQVAAAQTTAIGPFGLRTCASPLARTHAREVVVVLLAVPPLPSRCASWRAVCVTSVCPMSAHAPRAAATLLVIAEATSRVRTSTRKWCGRPCCCCGCGLRRSPTRSYTGGGAWLPRCARGGGYARFLRGSAARRAYLGVRPLASSVRFARRARGRLPCVLNAPHRG